MLLNTGLLQMSQQLFQLLLFHYCISDQNLGFFFLKKNKGA